MNWLAVVIVLLLILAVHHYMQMQSYVRRPGIDLTGGAKDKGLKEGQGVRYLGEALTVDQCELLCDGQEWCSAYTHAGTDCYGLAGRQEVPDIARNSGYRPLPYFNSAIGRRKSESLIVKPEDGAMADAAAYMTVNRSTYRNDDVDVRRSKSAREGLSGTYRNDDVDVRRSRSAREGLSGTYRNDDVDVRRSRSAREGLSGSYRNDDVDVRRSVLRL